MPQAIAVDQQTCEEEGGMDADLESDTKKKKKKKRKTSQKKKKRTPAKPLAVPGVPPKEVPVQRPVARPLLKEHPAPDVYEPGVFQQRKKAFVAGLRATGVKYADAVQQWMLSSERADYLSSLPESELKKRRFL